jgi:hypothetical protein
MCQCAQGLSWKITTLQCNKCLTFDNVMASHLIMIWRTSLNILCNNACSSLPVQPSYVHKYIVTVPYSHATCHSTMASSSSWHANKFVRQCTKDKHENLTNLQSNNLSSYKKTNNTSTLWQLLMCQSTLSSHNSSVTYKLTHCNDMLVLLSLSHTIWTNALYHISLYFHTLPYVSQYYTPSSGSSVPRFRTTKHNRPQQFLSYHFVTAVDVEHMI